MVVGRSVKDTSIEISNQRGKMDEVKILPPDFFFCFEKKEALSSMLTSSREVDGSNDGEAAEKDELNKPTKSLAPSYWRAESAISACVDAMSEVELKRMPKFKRCKITQLQLNSLMANFGPPGRSNGLMRRKHNVPQP